MPEKRCWQVAPDWRRAAERAGVDIDRIESRIALGNAVGLIDLDEIRRGDSVIATLAKTIYSSRQALAAAVPGEIKIEAPSTDKDADAVVHPGALTYLNDSQQSFFDIYGNEIFYGMLIFPVFGSALAGMASYLRRAPARGACGFFSAFWISCARRMGRRISKRSSSFESKLTILPSRSCIRANARSSTRRCGCRSPLRSISCVLPSPRGARRFSTIREPRPRQRPPLPPRCRPHSTVN